jgi:hypothetical protein
MKVLNPNLCSCGTPIFSAGALLFRSAFLAHMVCVSDFKYVVPTCFGLGLYIEFVTLRGQARYFCPQTDANGTENVVYRMPVSSRLALGIPRGIVE